jgi:hypothetical protein
MPAEGAAALLDGQVDPEAEANKEEAQTRRTVKGA